MIRILSISVFVLFLVFNSSCKKEDKKVFINCNECTIADWVGNYSGSGMYFDGFEQITEDVITTVSIVNTYDNYLEIHIVAGDFVNETLTVTFPDTGYSIHLSNNNRILDLTLSSSDSDFRLVGYVKIRVNRSNYYESISFEAFK